MAWPLSSATNPRKRACGANGIKLLLDVGWACRELMYADDGWHDQQEEHQAKRKVLTAHDNLARDELMVF